MAGMNSYMDAYLDRRMKYLIQDWDLATRNELHDFETRLHALEEDAKEIAGFEDAAGAKLDELERRLTALKGVSR